MFRWRPQILCKEINEIEQSSDSVTFDWLTSGDIKIRLNNDTANNPKVYGAGDLR